jgi:U3 small nucleolar RNA-associated protein 20
MRLISFQSVSQSLHTSTTSLLSTLVTYHLSCSNPIQTYKLIRRLLTALIHHCKSAEQFSPVADYLVNEYSTAVTSKSIENDHERLFRILRVVSVPCAVRGGSRLARMVNRCCNHHILMISCRASHLHTFITF